VTLSTHSVLAPIISGREKDEHPVLALMGWRFAISVRFRVKKNRRSTIGNESGFHSETGIENLMPSGKNPRRGPSEPETHIQRLFNKSSSSRVGTVGKIQKATVKCIFRLPLLPINDLDAPVVPEDSAELRLRSTE
jgi:hypothetical protein